MINSLKKWLSEPLTRDISLDDPALTSLRREVLQRKNFLRQIYSEWYRMIIRAIPNFPGDVLELGSGAGFTKELFPQLITSEIFWQPDLNLVLDGCNLPVHAQSLKAIIMTDVFHHIPNARLFLSEAARCLVSGGIVAMVEPWFTPWSGVIYRHFHHEPFQPESPAWEFESTGPLSGANGALPWIVFERDKTIFSRDFPGFVVETVRPMMPVCYLISGGLSTRALAPGWSYRYWRIFEKSLDRWVTSLGMFSFIVLRRIDALDR